MNKYEKLSFDVYSLFESKDVSEYNRNMNTKLDAMEIAYLINRNQTC